MAFRVHGFVFVWESVMPSLLAGLHLAEGMILWQQECAKKEYVPGGLTTEDGESRGRVLSLFRSRVFEVDQVFGTKIATL